MAGMNSGKACRIGNRGGEMESSPPVASDLKGDNMVTWESSLTGRHLAVILLDLAAAQVSFRKIEADYDAKFGGSNPTGQLSNAQIELSDELAKADSWIDHLRDEAKAAILESTGVSWARIEEANL
jgi:hypothetical protein